MSARIIALGLALTLGSLPALAQVAAPTPVVTPVQTDNTTGAINNATNPRLDQKKDKPATPETQKPADDKTGSKK